MSDVLVREARPGDGAALARIHVEAAEYYARLAPREFQVPSLDGLAEALDPRPEPRDDAVHRVAEVDGDVAGAVIASLLPPLANAWVQLQPGLDRPRLQIHFLEVAEPYCRRRIATRLVEAAEAWGRERGAASAITDTYLGSPLSIPFWKERMQYRERSVVLVKDLRG